MAEEIVGGMIELEKALERLGKAVGGKTLRSAALTATTPALRRMRALVPVGTKPHPTYRGRLVAPGFAYQSITRRSKFYKNKGTAVVQIGVKPEAFYAVQFLDEMPKNAKRKFHPRHWFKRVFIAERESIQNKFVSDLRKKIMKAATKK